jgi:hypothetical protein
MILVLGDVHSEYRLLFERLERLNPKPTAILQVGDLGSEDGDYPDFPIPTYFIQGNHENWDILYGNNNCNASKTDIADNLHLIRNGCGMELGGLYILGLGGNYSSRFLNLHREEISGGRNRHFTQEEINSCANDIFDVPELRFKGVDVLLTHEAPSPYTVKGRNCGIGKINEVISLSKPKLHFFGHHHYDSDHEYEGVKSYGLGRGFISGALLDPDTLEVKRVNLL